MINFFTSLVSVLILYALFIKYPANIAHILNTIFKLPHPGPNDLQGACSCREHEGKNKYSFKDYLKSVFKGE